MADTKVPELLNVQINYEFYSAYLYLDFSNFYKEAGLEGFANWFMVQAQEERDHALFIMQYLQNNNHKVVLDTIGKPDKIFDQYDQPLRAAFEHEKFVTSSIHRIYDMAYSEKDFRAMQFLDWFVKEQGEEENNIDLLIKKFELFGEDPKGLYMLDNELAARVYAAATLTL